MDPIALYLLYERVLAPPPPPRQNPKDGLPGTPGTPGGPGAPGAGTPGVNGVDGIGGGFPQNWGIDTTFIGAEAFLINQLQSVTGQMGANTFATRMRVTGGRTYTFEGRLAAAVAAGKTLTVKFYRKALTTPGVAVVIGLDVAEQTATILPADTIGGVPGKSITYTPAADGWLSITLACDTVGGHVGVSEWQISCTA